MAHEIGEHDGLALNRVAAWHGLGTIVTEDMTPTQAMEIADLDWQVGFPESQSATFGDVQVPITTHRTLFRLPRNEEEKYVELGSHKSNYTPLQNRDFFDIAYAVDQDVKVESAGSLFNGKRVYCLLRGDTINFKNDEVVPYIALMNSHDGTLALSAMPTSIRIVCNNTLSLALSTGRSKMFKVRHCSTLDSQVEEMKGALVRFRETGEMFKNTVEDIRRISVNQDKLLKFWTDAYSFLNGRPETSGELEDSRNVLDAWNTTFELERTILNEDANMWLAANAITNWLQHKEPRRRTSTYNERQQDSNLWGDNQDKSVNVIRMALQYA